MSGPYETERQALNDVRDIYEAARGSERETMQRLSTQRLTHACEEACVELGGYDLQVLVWLAGFEPQQAQVLAGIVRGAGDGAGASDSEACES